MKVTAFALIALLVVSACGDSRLERTGSGAAIGAGLGLVGGALCCKDIGGDSPRNGLFIGMAVGALIGLILNEPLFFNSHSSR